MRSVVIAGFVDELEKLSFGLPPAGMRRDDSFILELMKKLHGSVGGDDPLQAMQAGQMQSAERELSRGPIADWLSRALRTGEVSHSPVGPELVPGKTSMEHVLSIAEPVTEEQAAIAKAWPKGSPLASLRNALDERRASRAALSALMRR